MINSLKRRFKFFILIFIIMIGIGCAHPSGSIQKKGPERIEEVDKGGKRKDLPREESKTKNNWDVILDQLGFWIRWIPTDIIIFP
jgi:hypothetical protein